MTRSDCSGAARPDLSGLGMFGRGVAAALGRLKYGALELQWPDGRRHIFRGATPGPEAVFLLRDPACIRRGRCSVAASGWPRAIWTASGTRRT